MALPKRRTPKAKQNSRRSQDRIALPQIVRDPANGGSKVNHTAGAARDRKGRIVATED